MDINTLWNSGGEKDWKAGLARYKRVVKPANLALDAMMDGLDSEAVRQMSCDEFFAFLYDHYYAWLYTASNRLSYTRRHLTRYKEEGRMAELREVQRDLFLFDREDVLDGLSTATRVYGMGVAGASGLLGVLFPRYFGAVSKSTVKALRLVEGLPQHGALMRMIPGTLKLVDGVLLIRLFRDKAAELNAKFGTDGWTPRKIDKILWSVDRDRQG
ncbi:MAG: hypothetical protein LBR72_03640 [Oscillospiraceae bacterium]|jgi:hypothetical protein|nr:hypothetical protein [Oscillospiraceae bacterium]